MTESNLFDARALARVAELRPRTLWGQQVFAAAIELRNRLDLAGRDGGLDGEVRDAVNELTTLALELAARPPLRFGPRRLGEWWTGSRVEACWTYLHSAEVWLAGVETPAVWQATLRSALSHARRLSDKDPDRVALETLASEGRP